MAVVVSPSTWKTFSLGLAIRLAGAGLIVLGDGHPGAFRKTLVVVGVVLTVGGIGVLKYLLYSVLRRRPTTIETIGKPG